MKTVLNPLPESGLLVNVEKIVEKKLNIEPAPYAATAFQNRLTPQK